MSNIEAEIQQELSEIEEKHGIKIIHCIESGSRAWGFPSPDSDYDVRFIYAKPKDWYISLFEKRDVIERPIDEVLDISGWDIKKTLQLMLKANGPLYEWLHSPIVYRQKTEQAAILQKLAESCYNPIGIFHHYNAMTKSKTNELQGQKEVKLKTYLYALRTAMCCEWIIKHGSQPPVIFNELLGSYFDSLPNNALQVEIESLLEQKKGVGEKQVMPNSEIIESYLLKAIDRFEETKLKCGGKVNKEEFDKGLLDVLGIWG